MEREHPEYDIVAGLAVEDSLHKKRLHVNQLRNGLMRLVVEIPRRDGINEHVVFEYDPKNLVRRKL